MDSAILKGTKECFVFGNLALEASAVTHEGCSVWDLYFTCLSNIRKYYCPYSHRAGRVPAFYRVVFPHTSLPSVPLFPAVLLIKWRERELAGVTLTACLLAAAGPQSIISSPGWGVVIRIKHPWRIWISKDADIQFNLRGLFQNSSEKDIWTFGPLTQTGIRSSWNLELFPGKKRNFNIVKRAMDGVSLTPALEKVSNLAGAFTSSSVKKEDLTRWPLLSVLALKSSHSNL